MLQKVVKVTRLQRTSIAQASFYSLLRLTLLKALVEKHHEMRLCLFKDVYREKGKKSFLILYKCIGIRQPGKIYEE